MQILCIKIDNKNTLSRIKPPLQTLRIEPPYLCGSVRENYRMSKDILPHEFFSMNS